MGRRRRWVVLGVGGLAVVGIAAGAAAWVYKQPVGDVHNGASAPFTLTSDPGPTTTEPAKDHRPDTGEPWPNYGLDVSRRRDGSRFTAIHPPYALVWKRALHDLLEFPPSYSGGKLYLATEAGWVRALDAASGEILWARKVGSTRDEPAVWRGRVYVDSRDTHMYALSARSGRVLWRTPLHQLLESSPVVSGGRVFTGGGSNDVRALDAVTGRILWTFHASGSVPGSPSIDPASGRVFFGDYAGKMYCLRASDGHLLWSKQTAGLSSGLRSGTFYASPAVAYGRVYIANTDGKIYSFVESTGEVAWTYTLPWWAYGSPAVSQGRVFGTSYDGTFVALDARTGGLLWRHKLPYRSLGSPTVIGPLVYVSDVGPSPGAHGHLFAYNPGTGRLAWKFDDGKYSSVVVAGDRLVVAGYSHLYSLRPKSAAP
jgi:outer membrane protein assembly factor BamB